MIEFGNEVKDKVTGFKGMVVGRVEYITGCAQFLIQPACKKDNDFIEAKWFDEDRVQVLSKKKKTFGTKDNGPCDPAPVK